MLLVIALILATVALAALDLWAFWKLGEQDDVRRRRGARNGHASNATRQHPCFSGTPTASEGSRSEPAIDLLDRVSSGEWTAASATWPDAGCRRAIQSDP